MTVTGHHGLDEVRQFLINGGLSVEFIKSLMAETVRRGMADEVVESFRRIECLARKDEQSECMTIHDQNGE
jgi:hypothetical protein